MPKHTYLLLRSMERKYAEKFVKEGNIYFGSPGKWIEMYKEGDNRIGDDCEGVFAGEIKERKGVVTLARHNVERYTKNNLIYLRSLDIYSLPTLCFYGINDTSIEKQGDNYLWHTQDTGYVSSKYFKDLSSNITKKRI